MPTTPTTIDPLPTPVPQTNDLSNFDTRADAFLTALPTMATQMNASASQTYANSVAAEAAAVVAEAARDDAIATAGADMWSSGASYAEGDSAISPITYLAYRRKAPGGIDATDPSASPSKWRPVVGAAAQLSNRNKISNGNFSVNQDAVSGTVTLAAGDYGHDQWKAGAGGCTYTFATSGGVTTLTITAGTLVQPIPGEDFMTGTHVLSWSGTAQGRIGAGSYGVSGVTASITGGVDQTIEFGTGTLALVQLESGAYPTPYEFLPKSASELRCFRFYFKGQVYWSGQATNLGRAGAQICFPVRMRAVPSVSGFTNIVAVNFPSTAPGILGLTADGFTADRIANATGADGRWATHFTASARM